MSGGFFEELQKESPVHESLRDFVESAIRDTPELSEEQANAIRKRNDFWYRYYGRTIGWFRLDFAETEETRRVRDFYREDLRAFVSGIDTLTHIFYSLEMVVICLLKEHTRWVLEEKAKAELQQAAKNTEAQTIGEPASIRPAEAKPVEQQPKAVKKKRSQAASPKVQVPAQAETDQISLFG